MCDDWRASGVKALNLILQNAIGIRDTFVLTHVIEPGFYEKRLDHTPLDAGILEHSPCVGSIAPALPPEFVERHEECCSISRLYPVFDRDQDRPSILRNLG